MGPAIVSQPDGPRTDALVEAEGDREAIHWRRPSFNLSWGQWAHLDTTTRRGSAKRNAAFTLQHGAMLKTRQPKGCVPVVVSRCAPSAARPTKRVDARSRTHKVAANESAAKAMIAEPCRIKPAI